MFSVLQHARDPKHNPKSNFNGFSLDMLSDRPMLVQGRLPTEYTCFRQLSIGHTVNKIAIFSMPSFHGGHLTFAGQEFSTFWRASHLLHFRSTVMSILNVAERSSLLPNAVNLVMIERKGRSGVRSRKV